MKRNIVLCLLICIISLTGCNATEKKIIFSDNIDGDMKEIYRYNGISVYSKFSSIDYTDSVTDKISLSRALKKNKITMDEIFEKNNKIDYVNDGGSILYVYYATDNDISNIDFFVVKCNIMNKGINKIIFGNTPSIVDEC